ncbi:MAG: outer membrane lipoprotein-sorting protein [Candidatus Bipolaricaulia bacterium]
MRLSLWLLIAVGAIAALLAWAVFDPAFPSVPATSPDAQPSLGGVPPGHWLVGSGPIAANAHLMIQEPEGKAITHDIALFSLVTDSFQGLIAISMSESDRRWLRRGEDLMQFRPEQGDVVPVDSSDERRGPLLGSALGLEEFFVGFQLDAYRQVGHTARGDGGLRITLAAPDSADTQVELTYARIDVEVDADGRPIRWDTYDAAGSLGKTVVIEDYVNYQDQSVIGTVRVRDETTSIESTLTVSNREAHSLPSFGFTPATLQTMEVTESE